MTPLLARLRALAEAATPGPKEMWAGTGWPQAWREYLGMEPRDMDIAYPIAAKGAPMTPDQILLVAANHRDQAFHAALDPATVLALCDVAEAAEAVATFRSVCDEHGRCRWCGGPVSIFGGEHADDCRWVNLRAALRRLDAWPTR